MYALLINILREEETELIDEIIDIFNDFLRSKNISYDNEERALYQANDIIIFGKKDIDYLHENLTLLFKKWNIFPDIENLSIEER